MKSAVERPVQGVPTNVINQKKGFRNWFLMLDLVANGLALFGLYWFATSFFLAKRSLVTLSHCDEAITLLQSIGLRVSETDQLVSQGIILSSSPSTAGTNTTNTIRNGCWQERTIDSLVVLVVDALRFDFAYYNLPNSIGRRLSQLQQQQSTSFNDKNGNSRNKSNRTGTKNNKNNALLFQFVADPPTVTMQRLKALTTGGLPTFADISNNLGGATIEEDTWLHAIHRTYYQSRGLQYPSQLGFVGDDTWEDLFPKYFALSYPYPSFNTRDIDTVDLGCLQHLPNLLQQVRGTSSIDSTHPNNHAINNVSQIHTKENELEVVVVHFLGVDHVGHTYGPHNEHMDTKLKQMDDAISGVLDQLDDSPSCHVTLILGDHGMDDTGNHGGGTVQETQAALFVQATKACGSKKKQPGGGERHNPLNPNWLHLEAIAQSDLVKDATYATIHQIDLVPTISIMLGLPIPFANLGSLVPSLLSGYDIRHITAALALNAAQVWRYYTVYSATANKLPDLPKLRRNLDVAVSMYHQALLDSDHLHTDSYQQAASLLKLWLQEALDLGQRVWTRFDNVGMIGGIAILLLGLFIYASPLFIQTRKYRSNDYIITALPRTQYREVGIAILCMLFHCGLLTFSNSYILEEDHAIMYCLGVLSILVAIRLQHDLGTSLHRPIWGTYVWLIPIAARFHELCISGHGQDPSIRLHAAHNPLFFLSSLILLGLFRLWLYTTHITKSILHTTVDLLTLQCLAISWWEKRSLNPNQNGFFWARIALLLLLMSIPVSIYQGVLPSNIDRRIPRIHRIENGMLTFLCKIMISIMFVTGPSAASSLVLYVIQVVVIHRLSVSKETTTRVHSLVLAALWRLITRHTFFATNHGCAFNRLQLSAAFVATKEFVYASAGTSLFLNTFGWELVGNAFVWLFSQHPGRTHIWRLYSLFQLMEALTSCTSVTILRRHLMVWDIYAPHFLFAAIYTILNLLSQFTAGFLTLFL